MSCPQTHIAQFQNRDYIDWLVSLLNSEPSKMITEKTYANIFENGSECDKTNLSLLDKFSLYLNLYAIDNYINPPAINDSDIDATIHFSLILKVDDIFLLIESISYTYNSYTFVTILDEYNDLNYIDWDLYSKNKRPQKIEKLIDELNITFSELNSYIEKILSSDVFKDSDLSDSQKRALVVKFIIKNFK